MALLLRNSLFPSLLNEFFNSENHTQSNSEVYFNPSANIIEGADDYSVELALPGWEKKDVSINVDNDRLTITGKVEKSEASTYLRQEFGGTNFEKTFHLPESVAGEKISAKLENGILRLTVPKREEAKLKPARMIAIG